MPNKKFIITQFYNRGKDPRAVHGVLPEWTQVDRILSHHKDRGEDVYLVKFKDLPYVDASWETAKSLANDKVLSSIHGAQHLVSISTMLRQASSS